MSNVMPRRSLKSGEEKGEGAFHRISRKVHPLRLSPWYLRHDELTTNTRTTKEKIHSRWVGSLEQEVRI